RSESVDPKRNESEPIPSGNPECRLDLVITSFAAFVMASTPQAQEGPKDNKGFNTLKSEIVDLGPEIAGMEGRQLRLRLLQIEPGGHIGIHSHQDRPAVVYFLKGA